MRAMNNTTPSLPSPETTLVIVLGASKWPHYKFFDASDAFKHAASKLRKYFLDIFGLPRKNLLWLFDTSLNALDIDKAICKHLDTFADQARDVLVYYTGHGGLTLQGASIPDELARSTLEDEDITARGYAGLFSSGKDEESVLLPTHENTYFTEALLHVLLEGSSQTKRFLSFKDVYILLEEHLSLLYGKYHAIYPRTQRPSNPQLYDGDVASIPFFPNPQAQRIQRFSAERANTPGRLKEETRRNAQMKSPSPQLSLSPATTSVHPRRPLNVSRVLVALFCLTLLVGGTILFIERQPGQQTQASLSTASAETSNTYNAFVARNGIQFGFSPSHTRVNPYEHSLSPLTVPHLKLVWTAFAGIFIYSSPAVANGIVYVGSDDGSLYAFDAVTGKPKWEVATENSIEWSSPAVANGVIYIGSDDHQLYAFDALTGTPKWVARTGGSIRSSPAVVNGVVYVGSYDNKLYAFNAKTGTQLWVSAPTGGSIRSSPAVANGVVYVGSDDNKLYAFNAKTGTQLWVSAPTGSYLYSSPAVVNGMVYIGSVDGKLYAFNAATGKPKWVGSTGKSIYSSPTVANGVVYIGSEDDKLYAFNAATGKQLWVSAPTGDPLYTGKYSSPTVANGVIYIGSNNGKLYAFSLV